MKKRVLVVDDDSLFRKFLLRGLERLGWNVVEAENGEEGLEKLREGGFDAVISDLNMPGKISGLELLIQARNQNVPRLILITADSLSPEEMSILSIHGISLLEKPFTFQQLLYLIP